MHASRLSPRRRTHRTLEATLGGHAWRSRLASLSTNSDSHHVRNADLAAVPNARTLALMSRAFVRETDAEILDPLPERPISPHPNFVTKAGLGKIDARLHELNTARDSAAGAEDSNALPGIERELRYWRQRRSSARIIAPPAAPEIVRFGVNVQLQLDDGSGRDFRLVGEDEADPTHGLLSWTSPVGKALVGRRVGEVLEVFGRQAKIVAMRA
jgi:transcription elongation GreA/GreB family factor